MTAVNDNEILFSLEDVEKAQLADMSDIEQISYHWRRARIRARIEAAALSRYSRRLAKITPEDLALRLGVRPEWVRKFELRKSDDEPALADLINITRACGLWFDFEISSERKKARVRLIKKVAEVLIDPTKPSKD